MTKSPKNLDRSDKWIKMVNFKLSNLNLAYFAILLLNCDWWINMAQAWDKENNLESDSWSPEHRSGALSTEHREFMESKDI